MTVTESVLAVSLPANAPQIVIDGNDPGDVPGLDVEAYLDLEESGAIAPNATINFYLSGGSLVADPLYYAALRAVDDDQADIISLSFSQCESDQARFWRDWSVLCER